MDWRIVGFRQAGRGLRSHRGSEAGRQRAQTDPGSETGLCDDVTGGAASCTVSARGNWHGGPHDTRHHGRGPQALPPLVASNRLESSAVSRLPSSLVSMRRY